MQRPVFVASSARVVLSPLLWLMLGVAGPAVASDAAHAAHGDAASSAAAEPVVARGPEPASGSAVDPMDRLRQRLAERLAGSKTSPLSAAGDLQVVARTASVAPVTASVAAPARKAAKRRAATADDHEADKVVHGPAPWSYGGSFGPQSWAELKPEFSLCGNGQRQSPIDIRGGLAVDLDPVRFDYRATPFGVIDNGHTVQVNVAPGNTIDIGGKRFELLQFHFHRPSEERIDGRSFEMSLHLVHKDEQGRLAVVAVLFEKGEKQPEVQQVWNNLPLERNQESAARTPLDLLGLLPVDRRYITYMGSLTTPPCSEGVQWIVMRQPVTLTAEQINIFARIYPMNARPLQALAGRRIIQSQ